MHADCIGGRRFRRCFSTLSRCCTCRKRKPICGYKPRERSRKHPVLLTMLAECRLHLSCIEGARTASDGRQLRRAPGSSDTQAQGRDQGTCGRVCTETGCPSGDPQASGKEREAGATFAAAESTPSRRSCSRFTASTGKAGGRRAVSAGTFQDPIYRERRVSRQARTTP